MNTLNAFAELASDHFPVQDVGRMTAFAIGFSLGVRLASVAGVDALCEEIERGHEIESLHAQEVFSKAIPVIIRVNQEQSGTEAAASRHADTE